MYRFFTNSINPEKNTVIITGSEAHHLAVVLRLQAGTDVELLDGTATVTVAKIISISHNKVEMKLIRQYIDHDEERFPLTLAQAVLKGKKMDIILEKATELGVSTFIPILSRYSQPGKGLKLRMERWQRIALATKFGRTTPMTILPPCPLAELVTSPYDYRIFCWEKQQQKQKQKQNILLPDFFTSLCRILLIIGPEGGFHQEEAGWAIEHDFTLISLGILVLRAETAAINAMSIVRYLCLLPCTQKNQPKIKHD